MIEPSITARDCEIALGEAREALRPFAHHAHAGYSLGSPYPRTIRVYEGQLALAAQTLARTDTDQHERGDKVLALVHDLYELLGHGDACRCDKSGAPCQIDRVRREYLALFPAATSP